MKEIIEKGLNNIKGGLTTTLMGAFMVLTGFALYVTTLFVDTKKDIHYDYIAYWCMGGVILIVTDFGREKK